MNQEQAPGLRGPLKWGLAATVLATAAALMWPSRGVVSVSARSDAIASSSVPLPSGIAASGGARDAREGGLTRLQPLPEAGAASGAVFDPFVGVVPPAPPPPPPVVQPLVVAPPPVPPAQEYRFLGKVIGPDGVEQVLLTRGDTVVAIKPGTVLDNGYVVESITAEAIGLVYPPLAFTASLKVPTSP